MIPEYYAYSLPGKPPEDWQTLERHLHGLAETAREFADAFEAGECGGIGRVLAHAGMNRPRPARICSLPAGDSGKLTTGEKGQDCLDEVNACRICFNKKVNRDRIEQSQERVAWQKKLING